MSYDIISATGNRRMESKDNNAIFNSIPKEDLNLINELDSEFEFTKEEQEIINDRDNEQRYTLLNDAIIKCKEGDQKAKEYIIRRFHPFLTKYARFIVYGHIPYYDKQVNGKTSRYIDKSIYEFTKLFYTKEMTEEYSSIQLFYAGVKRINTIYGNYEYAEIYNQLILALFNMIRKYDAEEEKDENVKGTFHIYMSKCFHFEANRCFRYMAKDVLDHSILVPIAENLDDYHEDNEYFYLMRDTKADVEYEKVIENSNRQITVKKSDKITINDDELDSYDTEVLNFNWTNGVTCSEIFSDLTNMEREVIILIYIKRMTIVHIAKMYRTSKMEISKTKRSAIEKIRKKKEEMNL